MGDKGSFGTAPAGGSVSAHSGRLREALLSEDVGVTHQDGFIRFRFRDAIDEAVVFRNGNVDHEGI